MPEFLFLPKLILLLLPDCRLPTADCTAAWLPDWTAADYPAFAKASAGKAGCKTGMLVYFHK